MTLALTFTVGAAPPARVELTRTLTTVGAAPSADVRLAGVAPQWLVIQRDGDRLTLAVLATGQRHPLGERPLVIDGVTIARAAGAEGAALPVGALALGLAQADDATAALASLLDQAVAATRSDLGAVVLRQGGGHVVAVARDASGATLADGAAILSDTVLHDVLAGGRVIAVDDVAADPRLAAIPSVVNLALRSVIAIPMLLGEEVAGALYLGARRPTPALGPRLAADLAVAASMALPLVGQLRRGGEVAPAAWSTASPVMRSVQGLVARIAPTDLAVLVSGETGTGKELVARALHAGSPRAGRPLVAVNCGAIPANLFESELFGHRKGAFTGATGDRVGRVEAADGSTLLLDEVGELPPAMQAALLRVLQEREVFRVGDDQARRVDVRLVCATHRDLDADVASGRFRADLLYRLREVTIELPPLRARGDDVLALARTFLAEAEVAFGTARHDLGADARAALRAHDWPGNVRELRGVMRRAAVLADGPEVTAADLALPAPRRRPGPTAPPLASTPSSPPAPSPAPSPAAAPSEPTAAALPRPAAAAAAAAATDPDRPLALARDAFVAAYCAAALARHGGNREAAAAALGISTRSLHRYLSGERGD
ncbi:MAG: sigma 54-interacting transcriptional regulator [Myxococcales bacterium]|nr:sigma 54-interacting transcriptional regulator [Myxococcales bacterium]